MSFRPLYAKRSKSILTQMAPVKVLMQKASYLNKLQQCLNLYLSATLQEHCAVASFQNGVLTILMSNAQWTTRMRYQQNKLKQQLQVHHEFHDIVKIIVKVSPKPLKQTEETNDLSLSLNTATIISETAKGITDPVLKEALERLAKHTH